MSLRFDDALGLRTLDLRGRRGVVFCGRSGAGKSTAIGFLLKHHPAFSARRSEVDVIEELYDRQDTRRFLAALNHNRLLLIASHWPLWLHRILAPILRVRVIDLDGPQIKIERALAFRSIPATAGAIDQFCARFGANYTDLELVLERYPGLPFDTAWRRFRRECVVTESRPS